MYEPLIPCPSCARHVRARESACPFCASALPGGVGERAIPATPQRLGRAAAFFFGAAVTVASCATEVTDAPSGTTGGTGGASSSSGGQGGAGNGGNVTATGAGAGLPDAGPDDDGGVFTMYGVPPFDAGEDAGGPTDDAGIQPPYGTPPPPHSN
jgi:hypothetical protein